MSDPGSALLAAVLRELETLLPSCGYDAAQVAWLSERRVALERASRPVAEVKAELRGVIAGMGSLLDPFIADPVKRRERDRLADELDRLTAT